MRPEPDEMTPAALGIGVLFNTIHEAVIAAEADTGRIVLWNHAAETIFGWTSAEARGHRIELIVPEELKSAHAAGLAHYRDTGHGKLMDAGVVLELPAIRKDGTRITVEMTLNPLPHPKWGRYVFAILRDVSERNHVADALRNQSVARPLVRSIVEALMAELDAPGVTISAVGASLARGVDASTIEEYMRAFRGTGLGELSLQAQTKDRYTFIGNDLLERRASTTQPTCYLALGYLEGVVAALHQGSARGAEITCQSQGHAECRFVVMPR